LNELDVSENTALEHLNCQSNQLTALDVSENTALINFHCSGNQLRALDVSKNPMLRDLDCSANQLRALDVSKNTVLLFLWVDHNKLLSQNAIIGLNKTEVNTDENAVDFYANPYFRYTPQSAGMSKAALKIWLKLIPTIVIYITI
jgi:Leucine-rich repeat (LRR) protein